MLSDIGVCDFVPIDSNNNMKVYLFYRDQAAASFHWQSVLWANRDSEFIHKLYHQILEELLQKCHEEIFYFANFLFTVQQKLSASGNFC